MIRVEDAFTRLMTIALSRIVKTRPEPALHRLGSEYGGWWIPVSRINAGAVCYLGGLGEDGTLEQELAQLKCIVWSFDPTPRAIQYARTQLTSDGINFRPIGLWKHDTTVKFFEPKDSRHVSHSISNLQRTQDGFTADVKTVRTIMQENGHEKITLLKLDIEGAELEVIESMLADRIYPSILCIEFDAIKKLRPVIRIIRQLESLGYMAVKSEGRNYTFVNEHP